MPPPSLASRPGRDARHAGAGDCGAILAFRDTPPAPHTRAAAPRGRPFLMQPNRSPPGHRRADRASLPATVPGGPHKGAPDSTNTPPRRDGASCHTCSVRQPLKGSSAALRPGPARQGRAARATVIRPLRSSRPYPSRIPPVHALRPPVAPLRARAPTTHHRGATLRSGAEPPFIRQARRPPCTTSTASTPRNTPSPPLCARTPGSSAQRPSPASSTPATSGTETTPSTQWARRSASSPGASPPTASSSPTSASPCSGASSTASTPRCEGSTAASTGSRPSSATSSARRTAPR